MGSHGRFIVATQKLKSFERPLLCDSQVDAILAKKTMIMKTGNGPPFNGDLVTKRVLVKQQSVKLKSGFAPVMVGEGEGQYDTKKKYV